MPNSHHIIIVLMLSALAIPLAACQDRQPSARSPAATQGDGTTSTQLLPGEASGCDGDICEGSKPFIDQ
jgi:hypothetical protein